MKKLAIVLLALLVQACQSSTIQPPKGANVPNIPKAQQEEIEEENEAPEIIQSLQKISSKSTEAQIELILSQLLSLTASAYRNGLEIYSIAYDQTPRITPANMLIQSSYQVNTIYSSWIEEECLYQVARYETSDENGYRGDIQLSKINEDKQISVLCELKSPEQFSAMKPELEISRIDEQKVDIEGDYDLKRLNQMLQNRQMQYISGVLGKYLDISPINAPQLFDFILSPQDDGYIFSIQINNLDEYNSMADLKNPHRGDIDSQGIITASNYQTDEIWMDITLDSQGVIRSINSTIQESYEIYGQSFQILEEQQLFIHEVPSSQALPFVMDFFSLIDKQTLKVGSSFELEVPISNMN